MNPAWLLASAICGVPACGENVYFLPGDSYFPAVLELDDVRRLSEEDASLDYARPAEFPGAFCGDIGYARLSLKNVPAELRANLKAVYFHARAGKPRKLNQYLDEEGEVLATHEMNGLHAFFYNDDFDFRDRRLFVKYNEEWVEQSMRFGYDRSQVHLENHVCDKYGIGWRDAARVSPLKVSVRPMPDEDGRKAQSDVLVEPSASLKCIVAMPGSLAACYEVRNGATIFVITSAGARRYVAMDGEWRERGRIDDAPN